MEEQTPASINKLNLSEALLAPLNAIFEAQVHAARSFLSFVLQMGFRHKYSEDEIKKLRLDTNNEESLEIVKNYDEEQTDRGTISQLRQKQKDGTLSGDEMNHLKALVNKWDDIYSQDFTYIDDQGNENLMSVPNLALIPVKPLSIETASFKFDMEINNSYENYETVRGTSKMNAEQRPWMLIQPKRLSGTIVPHSESGNRSAISIEINIKSTEMPNGLSKLLTTMTESSRILPKDPQISK